MRIKSFGLVTAAVLLAACAGTPGPGDAGYPYNVDGTYAGSFTVEGQAFSANLQVTTESGGTVSGTFEVTQPIRLSGVLEGTLMGDQLTMTISYSDNPMTGCTAGTVSGTTTVTDNGQSITGPMTIDDCGQTLQTRVDFSR